MLKKSKETKIYKKIGRRDPIEISQKYNIYKFISKNNVYMYNVHCTCVDMFPNSNITYYMK